MKKLVSLLTVIMLCLVIVFVATGCGSKGDSAGTSGSTGKKVFLNIATGPTSGSYLPIGTGISKILNDHVPNITCNIESTGGSIDNVELVASGQTGIALAQNDTVFYATNGTEMFKDKGKVDNLTAVGIIFPETAQLIALKSSNIKSVSDLVGKRLCCGHPGSGGMIASGHMLEAYGLTYDDLGKAEYLALGEAVELMKDNQTDAAFVVMGTPTASISEICTTHEIELVPIEEKNIRELQKRYPFYKPIIVPKGTYKGIDQDVTTMCVSAMLIANKNLDTELVYNITKAIFENNTKPEYQTHKRVGEIDIKDALEGIPIELHPGAEKYYKEVGLIK
jgi:TRAP transporter TAXI family solute receptor